MKIIEKLDKLQEKYEQKAYRYQMARKWERKQFWLGRAKGVNDAIGEISLKGAT